jgi:ankyrin repeat protein
MAASVVSRASSAAVVDATNKAGRTALHVAANGGHAACVAYLLAHRADANASDDKFLWTPLHAASAAGHADVCALLIAAGADAEAADRRGRVPHQLAEGLKPVEAVFKEAAAKRAAAAAAAAAAAIA